MCVWGGGGGSFSVWVRKRKGENNKYILSSHLKILGMRRRIQSRNLGEHKKKTCALFNLVIRRHHEPKLQLACYMAEISQH